MTIMHKHHIIPRHMGGTNHPSNIKEVTIEQHAEEHRILYERYGHWQDKLAWEGLSNKITQEEAHLQVYRLANLGKKLSDETKLRISNSKKGKSTSLKGRKFSEEHRANISKSHKGKFTRSPITEQEKNNHRERMLKTNPMSNPESLAKVKEKASQYMWITDGVNNKRIKKADIIPEGFVRGRTYGNQRA